MLVVQMVIIRFPGGMCQVSVSSQVIYLNRRSESDSSFASPKSSSVFFSCSLMAMSVASLDRFRAASLVRRMNATKKDKNRHLREELVYWSNKSSTEKLLPSCNAVCTSKSVLRVKVYLRRGTCERSTGERTHHKVKNKCLTWTRSSRQTQ